MSAEIMQTTNKNDITERVKVMIQNPKSRNFKSQVDESNMVADMAEAANKNARKIREEFQNRMKKVEK